MAHDWPVSSTTPRPTGRKNARLGQTVGDMVRSLAIVLAVVGLLVAVTYQSQSGQVREVDVAAAQVQAQRQAPFELLTWPGGPQAQATSVRWQATERSGGEPVWHVGYLVDGADYLQVSQSETTEAGFVPEQTSGGQPQGEVALDGVGWQRYESTSRRSLVAIQGGVTTVVSGTLAWPLVEAAALAVMGAAAGG